MTAPTVHLELPPESDSAAVDVALERALAGMAAENRRVAVDACLCPCLFTLAARALATERRYGPSTPAGLAVVLTFPAPGGIVVYDGETYTVYADAWARTMGRGRNTGRHLAY